MKKSWIAVALLAAACGSGRLGPQPVPLDRVACSTCDMLVSDARTAAQALLPGEDPRFYDDIGCAARDRVLPAAKARVYVSAGDATWLEASNAFFARVPDARTPMGYGILAFPTRRQAQARDREGRARTWQELTADRSSEAAR